MAWKFERVAGPYKGITGGVAWDGSSVLFSAVQEERIFKFDPVTGRRRYFPQIYRPHQRHRGRPRRRRLRRAGRRAPRHPFQGRRFDGADVRTARRPASQPADRPHRRSPRARVVCRSAQSGRAVRAAGLSVSRARFDPATGARRRAGGHCGASRMTRGAARPAAIGGRAHALSSRKAMPSMGGACDLRAYAIDEGRQRRRVHCAV